MLTSLLELPHDLIGAIDLSNITTEHVDTALGEGSHVPNGQQRLRSRRAARRRTVGSAHRARHRVPVVVLTPHQWLRRAVQEVAVQLSASLTQIGCAGRGTCY